MSARSATLCLGGVVLGIAIAYRQWKTWPRRYLDRAEAEIEQLATSKKWRPLRSEELSRANGLAERLKEALERKDLPEELIARGQDLQAKAAELAQPSRRRHSA